MIQLQAAIKDKTNQIKYQVEYRMRMKDNQYQWFRASAEVIRRLDGSASRIAGIFINIDAEKAKKWIATGAQPTDTVRVLLKKKEII